MSTLSDAYAWERIVDEDDPKRCHGVHPHGQCKYKKVEGSDFCPRHGGNNNHQNLTKDRVRNYRLTKWRARVCEFSDSPEVKSLREEIGIVRVMIEEIMEKCETPADLIIYSGKLQSLIMDVEKLVVSCHKLEQSNGVLLDKTQVLVVADSLVKIVSNHVEDSDALDTIATSMLEIIAKVGGLNDDARRVSG